MQRQLTFFFGVQQKWHAFFFFFGETPRAYQEKICSLHIHLPKGKCLARIGEIHVPVRKPGVPCSSRRIEARRVYTQLPYGIFEKYYGTIHHSTPVLRRQKYAKVSP